MAKGTAIPDACAAAPVSSVQWKHRDDLDPNDYNPNSVAPPELRLLEISILEDGWTQPLVALDDGTIVDGYHRWLVSGSDEMLEKYGGYVPVATVAADETHRKMSTIRHNRARGTHGIVPMAEIVRHMLEDGVSEEEIQRRLQMEDEEVHRLADRAGMPARAKEEQDGFGMAWAVE